MFLELPKLKFDPKEINEYMSEQTVSFHYGKHHQAYASKANELMKGTDYDTMSLEGVIKESNNNGDTALFNNAAQFYNHNIFWDIMSTESDKNITPEFEAIISKNFGSFEEFKAKFVDAGMTQFGSGWAWLVKNADGSLEVVKGANAYNPIIDGKTPLLGCDVWEHSYYLDYQNLRKTYIENFLNYLVNWKVIEKNFNE